MMWKWIGLVLLCGCTVGIGEIRCRCLRERTEMSCAVLTLAREIREKIAQFRMPLSEIYAGYEGSVDGGEFDRLLREEGLASALAVLSRGDVLAHGVLESMQELASHLGRSEEPEQLAVCDRCIQKMERICDAEQTQLAERVRVTRTLSIAGAIALVILFI